MTRKDKLFFNFDGKWSSEFGLLHVNTDSGLFEETLVASRSIIETPIKGKDRPLFNEIENSPLEFELSIAFENGFTDEQLEEVVYWMVQDYYKPLYFEEREGRVYYCIVVDEPKITHTGTGQGYITLQMRCNSPFAYSPIILSQFYNFSTTNGGTIEIFNDGYGWMFPEISIEKIGAGKIVIRNVSNGGEEFEIGGLVNGEDIYINTEKGIIETDMSSLGIYRYDTAIGEFTRLSRGKNVLQIVGNCRIQFRYQMKYRL